MEDQLEHPGVMSARDFLAVIVGMYLLRYYQDRSIRSDRHFWHQMTIRILRLSKPRRDAGAGHTYHRRITVGKRETFTDIMKQTRLMTLGYAVSRQILDNEEKARLPQIEGIAEPFKATSQTTNHKDLK